MAKFKKLSIYNLYMVIAFAFLVASMLPKVGDWWHANLVLQREVLPALEQRGALLKRVRALEVQIEAMKIGVTR